MMRLKAYLILALSLLFSTTLSLNVHAATALYVDPGLSYADVGETFTVDVKIANAVDLFAWQVNMSFNPEVLGFVNVTEGDFLKSQPEGTSGVLTIEESWALFGWATKGEYVGESGSGTLATLEFEVLQIGESPIEIETERNSLGTYTTFLLKQGSPNPPPDFEYVYPPDLTIQNGYFSSVARALTIAVNGMGTTDPAPGVYSYAEGANVSVTAVPDIDHELDHWTADGVNAGSANPYSVTMDSNHTLTAFFVGVQYALTIDIVGSGTTDPIPGTYAIEVDTTVEVAAIPDSGWMLDYWELDGVQAGAADPHVITIDADHTLTAFFRMRLLSVELTGEHDYALMESVPIRISALITDTVTLDTVSDADVSIDIYDSDGNAVFSDAMVEWQTGTGIYEWKSAETIRQMRLEKDVYLARVQASWEEGPVASAILQFHIDPPGEEPGSFSTLFYVIAVLSILAFALAPVLLRLRLRSRLRTPKKREFAGDISTVVCIT